MIEAYLEEIIRELFIHPSDIHVQGCTAGSK